MALNINDGTRESRLELDRRATGEQDGAVPQAHRDALASARERVAPFDYETLRARSHRLADAPPPTPSGLKLRWWTVLVPLLAAAAALALFVQPSPPDGYTGLRTSGAFLDTFVLQDGVGQPLQAGTVLREGDRVQFSFSANGTGTSMVLLSVDGEGTLTVFWPAEGDIPEPIAPYGSHLLEDSIELDAAAGPEAFVVLFGADAVSTATERVLEAYSAGGPEGLSQLARRDPSVDVVIIDKE